RMEFHALSEMECDDSTVRGNFPALGKPGYDIRGASGELDQLIEYRTCGIEAGAGDIESRREVFGTSFRAIDQRFCVCSTRCQHRAHHQSRHQHCVAFHKDYLPSVNEPD